MTTRPTRSAPNRPRPPPTRGPPGTRPWPRSARPTAPTCAACPTAGCCTCATPTRSRPPGPPGTSGTSCARSAPPPGTPAWPACAPPLRPAPPPSAATTTTPRPSKALAAGYQALEQAYRQRETVFATVMADRADWDKATRAQRHLAVAADAELRRRHPGQYFAPLRSAEPEPATGAQRDDLTLTPDAPPGEIDQQLTDLAAGHRTFAAKLADRQSQMIPSEDPDYSDLGPAFPAWTSPGREPILQPPKPEIPPSPQILERAMDRDADWEAAD